jgi:RNA polymerase primary sigma factor
MKQIVISKSITNRDNTILEKYLKDISQESLLTPDEEVELAQRVRNGDEAAAEKLIKANLRFVVSVAKQYQNRGVSLQDLINEGNLGLIKAAHRFDETRGFKFISFAVAWIRQAIMQAVSEQSRIVRLPMNKVNALSKIRSTASALEQELKRQPSVDEIAQRLDYKEDVIDNLLGAGSHHVSLDEPIDDDGESTMIDFYLNNDDTNNADSVVERKFTENAIKQSLEHTLSEKERKIISMYFGVGVSREYSLEEIALALDMSRERTRQVRDKALRKLREQKVLQQIHGVTA